MYRITISMVSCPEKSCMVRTSAPVSAMSVMAVCLKVCGVTTPWIEASSNHDLSKRHFHALVVAALAATVGERPPVRVDGLAIPVNYFDVVLEDALVPFSRTPWPIPSI